MNIKPVIYENLTTKERIIATLEANARNDEEEKARLVKTCPKKSYRITDPAYTNMMESFYHLALVVESDMRGCALNFFMLYWLADNPRVAHEDAAELSVDLAPGKLMEMISIQEAWLNFLDEEGIPLETAAKAFGELQHFGIGWAQVIAEQMNLRPDEEIVGLYKYHLCEYIKKISD